MKDFDAIKDIWQQSETTAVSGIDKPGSYKQHADVKSRLMRQQLWAGIMLSVTGIFIIGVTFFSGMRFQLWITYLAVVMMILVVWIQAIILFNNYRRLSSIDDTLAPSSHLEQWKQYYDYRKRQLYWNKPLYFIFLNLAMGLYFIEVMSGRPVLNIMLFITVYTGWMLFAYFVLGRRSLRKEEEKLRKVITELESISGQLITE